MGKLTIVHTEPPKKASRPTRAKVLARLEAVADERAGGHADLDEAFAALERLGPGASQKEVQAAQHRLRDLLAAGL